MHSQPDSSSRCRGLHSCDSLLTCSSNLRIIEIGAIFMAGTSLLCSGREVPGLSFSFLFFFEREEAGNAVTGAEKETLPSCHLGVDDLQRALGQSKLNLSSGASFALPVRQGPQQEPRGGRILKGSPRSTVAQEPSRTDSTLAGLRPVLSSSYWGPELPSRQLGNSKALTIWSLPCHSWEK